MLSYVPCIGTILLHIIYAVLTIFNMFLPKFFLTLNLPGLCCRNTNCDPRHLVGVIACISCKVCIVLVVYRPRHHGVGWELCLTLLWSFMFLATGGENIVGETLNILVVISLEQLGPNVIHLIVICCDQAQVVRTRYWSTEHYQWTWFWPCRETSVIKQNHVHVSCVVPPWFRKKIRHDK